MITTGGNAGTEPGLRTARTRSFSRRSARRTTALLRAADRLAVDRDLVDPRLAGRLVAVGLPTEPQRGERRHDEARVLLRAHVQGRALDVVLPDVELVRVAPEGELDAGPLLRRDGRRILLEPVAGRAVVGADAELAALAAEADPGPRRGLRRLCQREVRLGREAVEPDEHARVEDVVGDGKRLRLADGGLVARAGGVDVERLRAPERVQVVDDGRPGAVDERRPDGAVEAVLEALAKQNVRAGAARGPRVSEAADAARVRARAGRAGHARVCAAIARGRAARAPGRRDRAVSRGVAGAGRAGGRRDAGRAGATRACAARGAGAAGARVHALSARRARASVHQQAERKRGQASRRWNASHVDLRSWPSNRHSRENEAARTLSVVHHHGQVRATGTFPRASHASSRSPDPALTTRAGSTPARSAWSLA